MDIKEYKCFSCEKINNYSSEMRCSSCNALHNESGEAQKFNLEFKLLTTGEEIKELLPLNENELRMVLGLSSINDDIWIKQLNIGEYINGVIKYTWQSII